MYYLIKIITSALLITLISEVAKRSSTFGAFIASLPLISIIAFVFMYVDNKDVGAITDLSKDIFWLVIPSLALFVSLPILLNKGLHFYAALGIASSITIVCYFAMISILKYFGMM